MKPCDGSDQFLHMGRGRVVRTTLKEGSLLNKFRQQRKPQSHILILHSSSRQLPRHCQGSDLAMGLQWFNMSPPVSRVGLLTAAIPLFTFSTLS